MNNLLYVNQRDPLVRLGMSLESEIVRNYTICLECCLLIDKFA